MANEKARANADAASARHAANVADDGGNAVGASPDDPVEVVVDGDATMKNATTADLEVGDPIKAKPGNRVVTFDINNTSDLDEADKEIAKAVRKGEAIPGHVKTVWDPHTPAIYQIEVEN
jgi:archaellum component FlaG (FlaF/FlaG flagellin family)